MFTCTALKHERRLGYQLFQIAATMGIAAKYRLEWVLPTWSSSGYFRRVAPQTTFPLHIDAAITPCDAENPPEICLDDRHVIDLRGNFHSDRYFHHCIELVREQFQPQGALVSEVEHHYHSFLRSG